MVVDHDGLRSAALLLRGSGVRPLMLAAEDYRQVLEDAGLEVRAHRFRNRLPLAHILFVAQKPLEEGRV